MIDRDNRKKTSNVVAVNDTTASYPQNEQDTTHRETHNTHDETHNTHDETQNTHDETHKHTTLPNEQQ